MLANWARLLAVATIPTMEIRKISGAEAPARLTISPVVKNRLKAGAICATPGMITPNRPSWPRRSPVDWEVMATALALLVPQDEVQVGAVDLGRVLPHEAMPAVGRRPLRAGDALV